MAHTNSVFFFTVVVEVFISSCFSFLLGNACMVDSSFLVLFTVLILGFWFLFFLNLLFVFILPYLFVFVDGFIFLFFFLTNY